MSLVSGLAYAQVSVTTFHNDNSRTGLNAQETILTPANVNNQSFGKLFSVSLDGFVYAQPLYLPGVMIGGAAHNVVYLATEHDSVYAIDADSGTVYAQTSLIPPGGSTVSSSTDLGCPDLIPEIGITGTPVIDPATNTLYAVAKSKNAAGAMVQYLHALDVTTLVEKFGGPTLITASVPGTAPEGNGTTVPFNTRVELQRPALLLENGHVVVGFAGHCDFAPWHGWVMSYSASTLAQEAVFNVTPDGAGGGVWMSGDGPAADSSGNIYFATGNGSWTGITDYGDSIVKLGPPSGGQFPVVDYYTPWNQAALYSGDIDVSSGGLVLLPALPSGAQYLAQMGKSGSLTLLNMTNLGQYCPNKTPACSASDPNAAQEILGVGGVWGSPAYWNGNFYLVPSGKSIEAFSFNAGGNAQLSLAPTSQTTQTFQYAAPSAVISANGNSNGILWAIDGSAYNSTCGTTGVNCLGLFAFDATNLSNLLYSSSQSANDSPGVTVKYAVPIVANGKVYVGTQSGLSVYGLLSHTAAVAAPSFSLPAGSYAAAQQVSLTDANPAATIYYTTDGSTPTTGSSRYGAPLNISANTTIQAIAVASGYTASPVSSATYTFQSGSPGGISLASVDNVYAISNDGTATINGGLDGGWAAYSANLLGNSVVWNGTTFTLSSAGVPSAVSSTTVPLPNFSYATLNLLGTAVNGPQVSQPFIVTYTDGTSTTFTQSLSDWGTPLGYSGESIVVTMAYRISGGGTPTPGPFYLYGYSFALNSAKSVASVTLPNNSNVIVLAMGLIPASTTASTAANPGFSPAPGNYGSTQPVTLSDSTPGATIYYTTNGTTPSTSSSSYSAPISVSANTTIQAIAVASGYNNSMVVSGSYTINAPSPTFNPAPGSYSAAQTVTLADGTTGAAIYYTTDGSTPTTSSARYSAPLAVSANTTIQAIAVASGYANSAVAGATYIISAATPTVSPAAGSVTTPTVNVSIADSTPGAVIYYTLDGSTPTSSSARYSAPLSLSASTTVKAIAVASGYTNSAVASASYTFAVQTPVFSPASGNYSSTQTVSLSDSTPGDAIYYTTDGSTPTTGSAIYSAPLTVSANTTIKAIGVATGYNNSAVASATYAISASATAPVVVNLASTDNVYGIVNDGSAVPAGGLDGGYAAYSAKLLGTTIVWNGSTFTLGAAGAANAVSSKTITLPAGTYSSLNMLGTAVNGPQVNQPFVVTYTDGSSTTFTQSLSDWGTPQGFAGESTVLTMAYRLGGGGSKTPGPFYLYGYSFALNGGKTIASIKLPTNGNVLVLAIDLTASTQTASPSFTPAAGNYSSGQMVSLSDSTPGAVIYYTLNGGTPTTSSAKYSAPLTVSATTTIQAIAVASGYASSAPSSATYTVSAASPTISPTGGSLGATQTVSLSDATPGATIYYTTNGTTPTTSSSKYSAPLTVSGSTTIQAIAVAAGYGNSSVSSATYTMGAAAPSFSPAAGTYSASTVTVTLADSTTGAVIYYTTNGATPTTSSAKYSSPLTLSANTTIQAIAVASGYTNSAVASATYGVTAPSPTFNIAGGNYTSTQTISLSDTIPGASIYYTTNGATPSTGSSRYSTPISVSATTTIQAIAVVSGYNNSAVASATYTISAPTPVRVSLGSAANVYAIVNTGSKVPGTGVDLHEYAYPAQQLGSQVSWAGSTFTFGAPGTLNGTESTTLALPPGNYGALNMLGTAVNGDKLNMPFTVTYSDGTTTSFSQSISDWCYPTSTGYAGQTIVVTTSYRVTPTGGEQAASCHVYGYSFALNSAKKAVSFTLPPSYVNNVVVLAVELAPP